MGCKNVRLVKYATGAKAGYTVVVVTCAQPAGEVITNTTAKF